VTTSRPLEKAEKMKKKWNFVDLAATQKSLRSKQIVWGEGVEVLFSKVSEKNGNFRYQDKWKLEPILWLWITTPAL
jgi:hypothetical protein